MDQPVPTPPERFFFQLKDRTLGPFDLMELAAECRLGTIGPATPCREEKETAWTPLGHRPEYALVKEMPIEAIARHLEAEEAAGGGLTDSRPGGFTTLIGALVVGLLIGVLAYVALSPIVATPKPANPVAIPNPSAAPSMQAEGGWTRILADGFMVESPEPLERRIQQGAGATYTGGTYQIDINEVPSTYTDKAYDEYVGEIQLNFTQQPDCEIISRQDVVEGRYKGRDIIFSFVIEGRKFYSGLRILAGNGKVACAHGVGDMADLERFVHSFQLQ